MSCVRGGWVMSYKRMGQMLQFMDVLEIDYISVCTYIYVYDSLVYMYIYVIYIYINMYMYANKYVYTYIHIYADICIHIYT